MASDHLPNTSPSCRDLPASSLDRGTGRRPGNTCRAWTPRAPPLPAIFDVLSLAELADRLHVSAQTLYDLRKKGRGPRGFRVGPRLMFRMAEVESWLSAMEDADGQARARRGGRP